MLQYRYFTKDLNTSQYAEREELLKRLHSREQNSMPMDDSAIYGNFLLFRFAWEPCADSSISCLIRSALLICIRRILMDMRKKCFWKFQTDPSTLAMFGAHALEQIPLQSIAVTRSDFSRCSKPSNTVFLDWQSGNAVPWWTKDSRATTITLTDWYLDRRAYNQPHIPSRHYNMAAMAIGISEDSSFCVDSCRFGNFPSILPSSPSACPDSPHTSQTPIQYACCWSKYPVWDVCRWTYPTLLRRVR